MMVLQALWLCDVAFLCLEQIGGFVLCNGMKMWNLAGLQRELPKLPTSVRSLRSGWIRGLVPQ